MTLRDDWKKLLRYAWTIRFIAGAVVLSALEVGFSIFANDPPIPRGVFAGLSALTSGAAFYARLVAQKGITPESTDEA